MKLTIQLLPSFLLLHILTWLQFYPQKMTIDAKNSHAFGGFMT